MNNGVGVSVGIRCVGRDLVCSFGERSDGFDQVHLTPRGTLAPTQHPTPTGISVEVGRLGFGVSVGVTYCRFGWDWACRLVGYFGGDVVCQS